MSHRSETASAIRFVGGRVVLPDRIVEHAIVDCRNGRIEAITGDGEAAGALDDVASTRRIDLEGCLLLPGLVDLHVHGGAGCDFMDGTVDDCRSAAIAHLRHGTTTLFPTTTTAGPDDLMAMIEACRQASHDPDLPSIPGIHLYGPYFAPDKVGCHREDACRLPVAEEFRRYFETGFVRIATCAAELAGAADFYREAARHDCLITCGHSNASWAEMHAAADQGMSHVDHFWCAMSSVSSLRSRFGVPMQASMAEYVLMHPQISTEVIADGHHLSTELLEFAYRMLGPDRLCLVTDANRALDMPPGTYCFGHRDLGSSFYSDGDVGWTEDRSSLASSVQGMDHMLRTMAQSTSAPLWEVVRMATLTPARRAGFASQCGSIEVGKRADLIVLDPDLNLRDVFLGGAPVELPS